MFRGGRFRFWSLVSDGSRGLLLLIDYLAMEAEIVAKPQAVNPCCVVLKEKYSKLEASRNALRQGVKIQNELIDKLQKESLNFKKELDGGKYSVFDRSVLVSNGVLHDKLLERIGPPTDKLKNKGIDFSLWFKPENYHTDC